ncbi:T9SS-dependent choice-of-anchor J family protein [Microscilla marina]|uniref:Sheath polysaccharide-degrading enzyme n=1 Tax=Microscilla marina ATCC 23134 TaxID=313606 RepID=A1ZQZ2_MICM2|nr:T9SS type A sorting domain-containing protein [Microscilla marina]EAY27297.1 sheath polysaccharide-degrading enzyme [Microscilla marina ATCC 23134]
MKGKFLLSFIFVLTLCYSSFAQQKPTAKATYRTTSAYVRDIPALASMDNIIAASGMEHVAPPKRRGKNTYVAGKGFPRTGDPLATKQLEAHRRAAQSRTTAATQVANFDAHKGTVLNDPTGAIGPNHYVYAFNSGFGILDRSGNVLVAEASLGTIFPGETLGDPVVMYDNFAGRFIIMQFSNTPNGILIAVCKGADPVNDGWHTYRFNTGSFPDYEKMSIWHDGYYITANKDQNSASTSEVVYVVERDKMLTGATSQLIGFPLPGIRNNGFYSPGGFNATGTSLPPSSAKHQIVYMQDDSWSGVSNDHLKIWTSTVDWNNTSNSSITLSQELNTTAFDGVFNGGSFQNLTEPGGGRKIDAIQATMMFMTNYRRFATHNSVVMNFVVDVNGNDGKAGIRWYELRQPSAGGNWSIYQEGTYVDPNGHSAFCGAIGMDKNGNIGMGYTIVSSSKHLSIRYTGRLASDPLGVMTQGEGVASDGDARSNRSDGRYGDYAQITMDPTDDLTFWHIGEYMKGSASQVRRSRVVAFRFGTPVPDTQAPSTPTNLTASSVSSTNLTLNWTASTDNVGVSGYDVYRGATLIGSASGTSYNVTGLSPNTAYSFSVRAKDAAGNISGASNTVNVTTTSTPTGCANGVASFPYGESFENTLGDWTQASGDDLNWTIDANGTPSTGTGPSAAAAGNSYVYVEASVNGTGYPNKRAILNSPCFNLSAASQATFTFKYHMFGATDMGSFNLEASNDNGTTWTSIWNQTGNQGNQWNTASVDLAAYVGGSVQLRFNRVTGSTWQADIAIDDVSVTTGSVSNCASGNLTLTITFDNYPQETSWEVTNAGGTVVASKSYSSANPDGSTVNETIAGLAAGDYTFTLKDSYGDGICCAYGTGSYTLAYTGGTIASGGEFNSTDATDFCIGSRSKSAGATRLETYALDKSNDIKLYPVPATGVLNINAQGEVDGIQIFSMYGRTVKTAEKTANGKSNTNSVDVSDLPAGTYFIRITTGGKTVTKKFLKQ